MDNVVVSQENVTPIKNYLLLDIPENPEQTASGVLLASDNQNSVPMIGLVVKAGDKCTIAVGSKVVFRRYSIDEVKIKDPEGEKKFWLLEEESVLAIIS